MNTAAQPVASAPEPNDPLYRSMRVVYAQGRWLTTGKLVLLSLFYLVSGTALLVLTSIYSALTL
jgi:hypothetical protein